jgi:potassium channel subfamily K, other eukaryote
MAEAGGPRTSDIFLVYNLVDPTSELPENEVGLRCSPFGLQVLETDTRNVVATWAWKDLEDVDTVVDVDNPENMELLIIQLGGEEFTFECEDSSVIIEELGKARRTAGLEQSGAPKREVRQPQNEGGGVMAGLAKIIAPKKSVVVMLLTLAFGYVVFGLILDEDKAPAGSGERQSWTLIDGIYFAILTMTTVGYGDIVPRTRSGMIATTVFVIFSVSAVGICISEIQAYAVKAKEKKRAKANAAALSKLSVKTSSSGQSVACVNVSDEDRRKRLQRKQSERRFSDRTKLVRKVLGLRKAQLRFYWEEIKAMVPVLLICVVGTLGYGLIEGWDFTTGFYVSCVTITAVGYGDYSPRSQAGRLFSIFFIPMGVALLLQQINKMIQIAVHSQHKQITSVKKLLEMDGDGDGDITLAEFQLFMLSAMHKVSPDDLRVLEGMFKKLDKSGDGLLSADDIGDEDGSQAMKILQSRIAV